MRNITVAAIQMRCVPDPAENLRTAERLVRQAAEQGAQVILLPELFEREYFCQQRRYDFYAYATPTDENPAVQMGIRLARELHIVLPISFFERDCNNFYNTVACIDADGTLLESRSSWGLFRDRRPEYYGAITHRAQDDLTR